MTEQITATERTARGMRKLVAFIVTQAALLALGAMAVAWGPADGIDTALTSIGATMSMALLYFVGGNVGEHVAKRTAAGGSASGGEGAASHLANLRVPVQKPVRDPTRAEDGGDR